MKFLKDKKGQASVFGQLAALAIGVATVAIVLVVTFLIMAQGQVQIGSIEGIDTSVKNATECFSSVACNATDTLTDAVADIPDWVPLVVITSIGSILIGLVAFFGTRRG